jgi:hypothetical protein
MITERLPVTDQGVVLPRVSFGDAKEVEVRAENGVVHVAPLSEIAADPNSPGPIPADDPLWQLCDDPIDDDITDASTNLDKYLYGANE